MQIDRNQLLSVLSEALDSVEKEVLGVTDHHAKRVAWLCIQMGRRAGMSDEEIADLMCKNFKKKHAEIYAYLLKTLTETEE